MTGERDRNPGAGMSTDPEGDAGRPRPRKGEEIEVVIESVVAGGRTVARLDGYVVFVRGGVPGDRVRVGLGKCRRSYGEGRVLEVLESSPVRVKPPCRSFGVCGGCSHQDMTYEAQLDAKHKIVADAFERIGGLQSVVVEGCHESPDEFRYRNKMEFSFAPRRWLERAEIDAGADDGGGAALGLHVPRIFDKVVEVGPCHLQQEHCDEILDFVRGFARNSGFDAYRVRSREGFWRFLVLRVGTNTGETMVHIVTSRREDDEIGRFRDAFLARFPDVTTLVHGVAPRPASAVICDESHVLHGPGQIRDTLLGLDFVVGPASFFQPNTRVAEEICRRVIEAAGPLDGATVFDLYSGAGTLSLPLAQEAERVVGLELVPEAVNDARANAKRNGIENVVFMSGEVRATLSLAVSRHGAPDVVVVDPPRAGIHPKALAALMDLAPPRIVYVSCNPATLARDVGVFAEAGYVVGPVMPLDQFPHTPHVEAIVALDRTSGGSP